MQTLIFTVVIVLLCSATISAIEAALFGISLSRAKIFLAQKKKHAVDLVTIRENMHKPITVLVVFNNIFNIVGSMIVGALAIKILGSTWLGLVSAVMTFLIIVVAEIIPKSIGSSHAESISLAAARPLLFLIKVLKPFIWLIEKATKPFTKKQKIVSEEEIRILSHLGHLEGVIEEDEKEMIHKVFQLNDLSAKDIMTPRTVIIALDGDKTLGEVEEQIYSLSHSRLPIYHDNLDKITGVCHQRDLLTALARDEKGRRISEFRHEVMFVPENMKADKLLPLFQKQRYHLAIVTDEFGGTAGLVTLEDVLEQLVGEIVDEKDKEIDTREKARRNKSGSDEGSSSHRLVSGS